jgi:hypothetical protein
MTEGRGQRTEDRGQRTDDRRQRTEGRGQMTDDRRQGCLNSEWGSDWKVEVGMRPPARRSHRGLRPGGKVEVTGRRKR